MFELEKTWKRDFRDRDESYGEDKEKTKADIKR